MHLSYLVVCFLCVLSDIRPCGAQDLSTDGRARKCFVSANCLVVTYDIPSNNTSQCSETSIPRNILRINLHLPIADCFHTVDQPFRSAWLFLSPLKWIAECWNTQDCTVSTVSDTGWVMVGAVVCMKGHSPTLMEVSLLNTNLTEGMPGAEFSRSAFKLNIRQVEVQDLNIFRTVIPLHFFNKLVEHTKRQQNRQKMEGRLARQRRHAHIVLDSIGHTGSGGDIDKSGHFDSGEKFDSSGKVDSSGKFTNRGKFDKVFMQSLDEFGDGDISSISRDEDDHSDNDLRLGVLHFGDEFLNGIPQRLLDRQEQRLEKHREEMRNKHKKKNNKQKVLIRIDPGKGETKENLGYRPMFGVLHPRPLDPESKLDVDFEKKVHSAMSKLVGSQNPKESNDIKQIIHSVLDLDAEDGLPVVDNSADDDHDSDRSHMKQDMAELEGLLKTARVLLLHNQSNASSSGNKPAVKVPSTDKTDATPATKIVLNVQENGHHDDHQDEYPGNFGVHYSATRTPEHSTPQNGYISVQAWNDSSLEANVHQQPESSSNDKNNYAQNKEFADDIPRRLHDFIVKNITASMSHLQLTEGNIMRVEKVLLQSIKKLRSKLRKLIHKTSPENQKKLQHQLEASMTNATYAAAWTLIKQLYQQKQANAVGLDWHEWGEWSPCSASCGGSGYKLRRRHCKQGGICSGPSFDLEACVSHHNCKAHWMQWSEWGECSATCGKGKRVRTRVCMAQGSGKTCRGHAADYEFCFALSECHWPYKEHLKIKVSKDDDDDDFTHKILSDIHDDDNTWRTRPPLPLLPDAENASPSENVQWSLWGAWSACSVTCGMGTQERRRICEKIKTDFYASAPVDHKLCPGVEVTFKPCISISCPHPVIMKSSIVNAPIGSNVKLVCNYNFSSPAKDIYWVTPLGQTINKNMEFEDKHYSLFNNTLIIRHIHASDLGEYQCVVAGSSNGTGDGGKMGAGLGLQAPDQEEALVGKTCAAQPCKHGATCEDVFDHQLDETYHYRCLCKDGYYGRHCEQKFEVAVHMPWLKLLAVMLLILIVVLVIISVSMCLYYRIQDSRQKEERFKFLPELQSRRSSIGRLMKPFDKPPGPNFGPPGSKAGSFEMQPDRHKHEHGSPQQDNTDSKYQARFGLEQSPYNELYTSLVNPNKTMMEISEREYESLNDQCTLDNLTKPSALEQEVMDLLGEEEMEKKSYPLVDHEVQLSSPKMEPQSRMEPPAKLKVTQSKRQMGRGLPQANGQEDHGDYIAHFKMKSLISESPVQSNIPLSTTAVYNVHCEEAKRAGLKKGISAPMVTFQDLNTSAGKDAQSGCSAFAGSKVLDRDNSHLFRSEMQSGSSVNNTGCEMSEEVYCLPPGLTRSVHRSEKVKGQTGDGCETREISDPVPTAGVSFLGSTHSSERVNSQTKYICETRKDFNSLLPVGTCCLKARSAHRRQKVDDHTQDDNYLSSRDIGRGSAFTPCGTRPLWSHNHSCESTSISFHTSTHDEVPGVQTEGHNHNVLSKQGTTVRFGDDSKVLKYPGSGQKMFPSSSHHTGSVSETSRQTGGILVGSGIMAFAHTSSGTEISRHTSSILTGSGKTVFTPTESTKLSRHPGSILTGRTAFAHTDNMQVDCVSQVSENASGGQKNTLSHSRQIFSSKNVFACSDRTRNEDNSEVLPHTSSCDKDNCRYVSKCAKDGGNGVCIARHAENVETSSVYMSSQASALKSAGLTRQVDTHGESRSSCDPRGLQETRHIGPADDRRGLCETGDLQMPGETSSIPFKSGSKRSVLPSCSDVPHSSKMSRRVTCYPARGESGVSMSLCGSHNSDAQTSQPPNLGNTSRDSKISGKDSSKMFGHTSKDSKVCEKDSSGQDGKDFGQASSSQASKMFGLSSTGPGRKEGVISGQFSSGWASRDNQVSGQVNSSVENKDNISSQADNRLASAHCSKVCNEGTLASTTRSKTEDGAVHGDISGDQAGDQSGELQPDVVAVERLPPVTCGFPGVDRAQRLLQDFEADERYPTLRSNSLQTSQRSEPPSRLMDTTHIARSSSANLASSGLQKSLDGSGEGGIVSARRDSQKSPRELLLRRAMENSYLQSTAGSFSSSEPPVPVLPSLKHPLLQQEESQAGQSNSEGGWFGGEKTPSSLAAQALLGTLRDTGKTASSGILKQGRSNVSEKQSLMSSNDCSFVNSEVYAFARNAQSRLCQSSSNEQANSQTSSASLGEKDAPDRPVKKKVKRRLPSSMPALRPSGPSSEDVEKPTSQPVMPTGLLNQHARPGNWMPVYRSFHSNMEENFMTVTDDSTLSSLVSMLSASSSFGGNDGCLGDENRLPSDKSNNFNPLTKDSSSNKFNPLCHTTPSAQLRGGCCIAKRVNPLLKDTTSNDFDFHTKDTTSNNSRHAAFDESQQTVFSTSEHGSQKHLKDQSQGKTVFSPDNGSKKMNEQSECKNISGCQSSKPQSCARSSEFVSTSAHGNKIQGSTQSQGGNSSGCPSQSSEPSGPQSCARNNQPFCSNKAKSSESHMPENCPRNGKSFCSQETNSSGPSCSTDKILYVQSQNEVTRLNIPAGRSAQNSVTELTLLAPQHPPRNYAEGAVGLRGLSTSPGRQAVKLLSPGTTSAHSSGDGPETECVNPPTDDTGENLTQSSVHLSLAQNVSFRNQNLQNLQNMKGDNGSDFEQIGLRAGGPLDTERQFEALSLRPEGPLALEHLVKERRFEHNAQLKNSKISVKQQERVGKTYPEKRRCGKRTESERRGDGIEPERPRYTNKMDPERQGFTSKLDLKEKRYASKTDPEKCTSTSKKDAERGEYASKNNAENHGYTINTVHVSQKQRYVDKPGSEKHGYATQNPEKCRYTNKTDTVNMSRVSNTQEDDIPALDSETSKPVLYRRDRSQKSLPSTPFPSEGKRRIEAPASLNTSTSVPSEDKRRAPLKKEQRLRFQQSRLKGTCHPSKNFNPLSPTTPATSGGRCGAEWVNSSGGNGGAKRVKPCHSEERTSLHCSNTSLSAILSASTSAILVSTSEERGRAVIPPDTFQKLVAERKPDAFFKPIKKQSAGSCTAKN